MTLNQANSVGYTKAVDLWALGCVAVVLLTGSYAFFDPATHQYSAVLARQCNMTSIQHSRDWQAVRPRPKNFVGRLLVLDESQRMTANQALDHEWFSNDLHKTNFEELYHRAIKHWRPRATRSDTFEFFDASSARRLARAQGVIPEKNRTSGPKLSQTVESHYQPFPRGIHSSLLWPKRKPGPSYIAPETKAAMEKWPSSARSDGEDEESALATIRRKTTPQRRKTFSMGSPIRREAPSPNKRTSTPFRFRKPLRSARSASLPVTPARALGISGIATVMPLQGANANSNLQPVTPIPSSLKNPSRLRRRSVANGPDTIADKRQKKRPSSVFDFEDAENIADLPLRKRSRSSDDRSLEDLDLSHHASAVAEEE
jgi:serine/threonine protein kinase